MRRLVYAPKVWIFIRSSNLGGRIYDVSSDITRGSVTQNLGEVSTVEFELRNRFHKWLRAKDFDNRLIFRPMDLVTVWMQRIAGHPIQVFTGYLDEVPYYQAYPGNAVFSASCTLKKLAYNWFDPGLQVFMNWIRDQPGWQVDPSTGAAVNIPLDIQGGETVQDIGAEGQDHAPASDGGFADLLGRFMVDIAGWDPDDVVIGKLPVDIPQKAAAIYNDLEGQTTTNLNELSQFMAQILGANGWTGGPTELTESPNVENALDRSKTLPPLAMNSLKKIRQVASANNIEPDIMVFAALVMSSMNANYNSTEPEGYGLYAMRPNTGDTSGRPTTVGANFTEIDGITIDKIVGDEFVATDVFAKRLNSAGVEGPWVERARQGDVDAMLEWIEAAVGYPIAPRGDPTTLWAQATTAVGAAATKKPKETPSPKVDAANVSAFDPQVLSLLSNDEKKVVEQTYKNSIPELGMLIIMAKKFNKALTISKMDGLADSQLFIQGKPDDLQKFFDSLKGKIILSSVSLNTGNVKKYYRKGQATELPERELSQVGILLSADAAVMKENPDLLTGLVDSPDSADDALGEGSITFEQLAAFSSNSAFASRFAFPTDYIMSRYLTGEKALMNDVSCLEAVKQFCQASMRTFRSLPDGRFLAFYPDYFGATRDPYWFIRNIEIVDFGIQLNDEALATHVYIVGDGGLSRIGAENAEFFNPVVSRGVATVLQAFILNSFIEPFDETVDPNTDTETGKGLLGDPFAFLQHFGYRPHREDVPLITNSFYEFLMAWQKFMWLWSQQFATMVEFTFQPEVMAGGLIEFPDHDVQMFCESVTHNFDYSAGFSTTASLSAPSIPKGKRESKINKPGFALGGAVNTVGVTG